MADRVKILKLGSKSSKYIDIEEGATVMDVVEESGLLTEDGLCVRLNNQQTKGDEVVKNGDLITITPKIRGGS